MFVEIVIVNMVYLLSIFFFILEVNFGVNWGLGFIFFLGFLEILVNFVISLLIESVFVF